MELDSIKMCATRPGMHLAHVLLRAIDKSQSTPGLIIDSAPRS